jgi:hypothetical protein
MGTAEGCRLMGLPRSTYYGKATGPVITDVLALLGRGAFLKAPLKKLELKRLPPHHAFQGGDLGFVLLQQIGGSGLVVESTGLVPCHPDPDQVAGKIVALRQPMQGLACNELLGDLTLEFSGCGCGAWPWLSSSESPAAPVNSQVAICPPSGAHSTMTPRSSRP